MTLPTIYLFSFSNLWRQYLYGAGDEVSRDGQGQYGEGLCAVGLVVTVQTQSDPTQTALK